MQSYGSDRVRQGRGDQFEIVSRQAKGWIARKPKTSTSPEHPGTAVAWDERIFEVVAAENHAAGGVRYVLEPWRDNHIIRVSDSYDEASEIRRAAEARASQQREKGRKAANFLGVFTGHLPAIIQEHLASDLGLLATKLTSLSLLLPLTYLIWSANHVVRRLMDPLCPPIPTALLVIGAYLFIESGIRLNIVWLHRRPIGSAAGWLAYLVYYLAYGKWSGALSPFTVPKGQHFFSIAPEDDVVRRDEFKVREPLVTLLTPQEQAVAAQRFGYQYRSLSFTMSWVLLLAGLAGVVTSVVKLQQGPRISALASLLLAGFIAMEQVFRLVALRRGPAASVLAVFARPFLRKLLN